CPTDCPTTCGDEVCECGENSGNCCADCASCGDGVCECGETCNSCLTDCPPTCGDGVCECGENCSNCPLDCATGCGDGCCTGLETTCNCPIDCPGPCCGNNIKEPGEECDGTDNAECEGASCSALCKCIVMPTVSEWGLIALVLLLLTGLAIKFGLYRRQVR
ncbi:MAG: hypothetical protein IIB57_13795, partial [Planctomycetes bacterium]|nr:hypothetical protein [Planctomycetota bacterium]